MNEKAKLILCLLPFAWLQPSVALAQWNPWQQQVQSDPTPYDHYRGGIDRTGFGYIHQMGGGQDESGYYRNPVPVQEAWGGDVPDGVHGYRPNWDHNIHILYEVQGGQIIRQDYNFNHPQR